MKVHPKNLLILYYFVAGCSFSIANKASANSSSSSTSTNVIPPITSSSSQPQSTSTAYSSKKQKVLVLDVDNTLYNEALTSKHGLGIETQIIKKTHEFGKKHFDLSKDECDEMYLKFGSTVEGLRSMLLSQGKSELEINNMMRDYYNEVYDEIDMSCLLLSSELKSSSSNTGYSHDKSSKERKILVDTLQAFSTPIYLASNSPRGHVLKVIKALGLGGIKFEGILTPDSSRDHNFVTESYPTKSSPSSFYHTLLQRFDPNQNDIMLMDDSSKNLEKAQEIGLYGMKVNGDSGRSLREALSIYTGHLDLTSYEFSDVNYLQSKNEVDLLSINEQVWRNVAEELSNIMNKGSSVTDRIQIIDLGAGLLSMLNMILNGGGGKEPLIDLLNSFNNKPIKEIEYIAYESNKNLLDTCWNSLYGMGFVGLEHDVEDEYIFEQTMDELKIIVKLRVKSFTEDVLHNENHNPHLVIGCCFADLFDPNDLTAKIMHFLRHCTIGGGVSQCSTTPYQTLVYFPITFGGITQFLPPKPFGVRKSSKKVIPSDTLAFRAYAQSLIDQHGHNLDPTKIIDAMKNSDAKLIASGSSVWDIDPEFNKYLWETMIYFFASTGPMMLNWDFEGWINRAKNERPKIQVMNQDLLFSMTAVSNLEETETKDLESSTYNECEDHSDTQVVEEIMFNSPYNVSKVTKRWETKNNKHLNPGQVEG